MTMLTAERLRELLRYDPQTGVFEWITQTRNRRIGRPVGTRFGRGYIMMSVDRHRHLAHRLAWLYTHGDWPKGIIDHINGNKADNRIANLRDADHNINAENMKAAMRSSKSGLMGASWHKGEKRWRAAISVRRCHRHLGYFDTAEEAHAAYMAAKRESHQGYAP